MNRRKFIHLVGSGAIGTSLSLSRASSLDGGTDLSLQGSASTGLSRPSAPRKYLFTDLRIVDSGGLLWRNRAGELLPLNDPPMPQVDAIADLGPTPFGIRLEAQPCRKEGPLDPIPPRGSVFDEGVYRAWRLNTNASDRGSPAIPPGAKVESLTVTAYESRDGYEWTSRTGPEIAVQPFTAPDADFFVDRHAPEAERFKGFLSVRLSRDHPRFEQLWERFQNLHPRHRDPRVSRDELNCVFGLVSPDGLAWRLIETPLHVAKADADCIGLYDEWLGRYVMYTRSVRFQQRIIVRSESVDFRRWTPLEPIIWPDLQPPYTDEYYVNCYTGYPGLEGYHLMFPGVYHLDTESSESDLFSSADGICWDRVPGGPVYAPGGSGWEGGVFGYLRGNLIPLGGDRIALPFSEVRHPHKYPRWPGVRDSLGGYAVWDKDRLSAIAADSYGRFQTLDLPVAGNELRVNVKVHQAGILQVGLDKVPGRSLDDCDPIVGDHSTRVVTWRGEKALRIEPGAKVGIQFRMRSGKIFGFEWGQG
ncbi:MAG: hypothetical protein R3F07_11690 [Opitutaceae bacterium]